MVVYSLNIFTRRATYTQTLARGCFAHAYTGEPSYGDYTKIPSHIRARSRLAGARVREHGCARRAARKARWVRAYVCVSLVEASGEGGERRRWWWWLRVAAPKRGCARCCRAEGGYTGVVAIGVCWWQAGYQATGNKGAWIANGGPQYTPSSNTACFPCLRARQKEPLL